jgi:hypothetical protein
MKPSGILSARGYNIYTLTLALSRRERVKKEFVIPGGTLG